eukprot:g9000.t1
MTSAIQALQQTLNQNVEKFQTVQKGKTQMSTVQKSTYRICSLELQKTQQSRQQLVQQKSENEMELNRLPDDANVYKLIGPALIKQDPVESKANVQKRIEYISGELNRSDNQVRTMESKISEHQKEILTIQKKIQTLNAKKGAKSLALFNSYLLNLQLPLLFYKKLLGQDLIAEDLKDIHPDVHRSLKQLLDMDSGVEELGLYFAVEENTGIGSIQEVDLKPNGSEIAVKAAFEPLRSGFLEVCQSTRLSLLQPIELEEILCGMRVTNIEDLKRGMRYTNYDSTDLIVVWFWEILGDYTEEKKRKLLAFWTGSDRVPNGGFEAIDRFLKIYKADSSSQSLPSSRTCSYCLYLPGYETRQQLKEGLDTALQHTEGFGNG